MKRIITTVIITMSLNFTFGQIEEKQETIYKNEFGVDATGFIKYFLTFNQTVPSEQYSPIYYLTYRRKLKAGNIRSALGGNYEHLNRPALYPTDSNTYFYDSYSLNFRLGWEFYNNIGKKSQVYYGVDFRPSISNIKNEAQWFTAGYASGYEKRNQYYGIVPLFGYRFKLNDRISLTAETSFSLIWSISDQRNFSTPTSSAYPAISDDIDPTLKSLYTAYSQPISVIVTFDL
jgi:hypothetical protein